MSEPTSDHHQCRHLKMDGVRCGRLIPPGHVHCYHHRHNRDPSFVVHHGKRRVPLLEDLSALQVTATATLHALINGSLDRRDARIMLYGVSVAASLLRFDLAEKRWFHQTGQTRPEPVVDFAVMGHEHVAVEDPLPAAAPAPCDREPGTRTRSSHPASTPCSSLDPEDDFLTPETFISFDAQLRVPTPAPGERDELTTDDRSGSDWPCPYRFNYCLGPGPYASCHYCTGAMRWEDVHPGEPDPGAPGPLPTVDLGWAGRRYRDISAPQPVARQHEVQRTAPRPALPAPEILPPAEPFSECEPESICDSAPRPAPEPASETAPLETDLAVLVASAEPALNSQLPSARCDLCPPAESATSPGDAHRFHIPFRGAATDALTRRASVSTAAV